MCRAHGWSWRKGIWTNWITVAQLSTHAWVSNDQHSTSHDSHGLTALVRLPATILAPVYGYIYGAMPLAPSLTGVASLPPPPPSPVLPHCHSPNLCCLFLPFFSENHMPVAHTTMSSKKARAILLECKAFGLWTLWPHPAHPVSEDGDGLGELWAIQESVMAEEKHL